MRLPRRSSLLGALALCVGCGAAGPPPEASRGGAEAAVVPPSCGPVPAGVVIEAAALVAGTRVHRAARGQVEQLAVCTEGAWRIVDLEPRQFTDGGGFTVRIVDAAAVDRTGDGMPEIEVSYRFTESLTALPPTGPYRQGEARAVVAGDGASVLLRYYVRGETDTAVATDQRSMVAASQWSTEADQPPMLSVVQSILVTEDMADDEDDAHGRPETSAEVRSATVRWSPETGAFEIDGQLWAVSVPGLSDARDASD